MEGRDDLRGWLVERTGQLTVPQIFAGDRPLALSDEGFCFRSYLGTAGAQYYRPSRAGYKGGRACEAPDTLANWQRYGALWFNAACHRSLYSYQTRAAISSVRPTSAPCKPSMFWIVAKSASWH